MKGKEWFVAVIAVIVYLGFLILPMFDNGELISPEATSIMAVIIGVALIASAILMSTTCKTQTNSVRVPYVLAVAGVIPLVMQFIFIAGGNLTTQSQISVMIALPTVLWMSLISAAVLTTHTINRGKDVTFRDIPRWLAGMIFSCAPPFVANTATPPVEIKKIDLDEEV